MKRHLELKDIAPYLPYSPQFVFEGSKDKWGMSIDQDVDWDNKLYPLASILFEIESVNPTRCQLVLRDPYDLMEDGMTGRVLMEELGCPLPFVHELWEFASVAKTLGELSVTSYKVMCRNHIDFGGLIKEGLAVNVNDVGGRDQ
jgi:hypothetical protein